MTDLPTNNYINIRIYVRYATSAGSYLIIYFPPLVSFDPTFDEMTDCRFNNSANSAQCAVTQTSNYVKMVITAIPGSPW